MNITALPNDFNVYEAVVPYGMTKLISKQDFVDWIFECLPQCEPVDRQSKYWTREDGRFLEIRCLVFPANNNLPELIEYQATAYTIKQCSAKGVRRFLTRSSFIYDKMNNPHNSYKQHSSGNWYNIF